MTDIVERLRKNPIHIGQYGAYECHAPGVNKDAADEIESLRQQLAESQADAERYNKAWESSHNQAMQNGQAAIESQAREKVLFSHLNNIFKNCVGWAGQSRDAIKEVQDVLSMPSDSTALDSAIRQAKREALLEAADKCLEVASRYGAPDAYWVFADAVRDMADELKD